MQIKIRELIEKLPHRLFGVIGVLIFYLILLSIQDFFGLLIDQAHANLLLDNVLHTLILVELLHLSIIYAIEEFIDPQELILIVLTAVGRRLIVTDLFDVDYRQTIVIGGILLICVYGLKALTEEDKIR